MPYYFRTCYKVFMIILLLICSQSYASSPIKPTTINFQDNDQITIELSNTDINRLYVEHEKVTAINAPSGLLTAHNDFYGSIYTNIYSKGAFTAFITTNAGRHFSLLILPKAIPGQTIALKPNRPVAKHHRFVRHYRSAKKAERASDYENTLVNLIQFGVQGVTPPGFVALQKNSFSKIAASNLPNHIKRYSSVEEKVSSLYLGDRFIVRILTVINDSKKTIPLSADLFYRKEVRALAILKPTLMPRESSTVIEVIDNV